MQAVEGAQLQHGIGGNLRGIPPAVACGIEDAAVSPLDGGGLVVGVAGHFLEGNGVAAVVQRLAVAVLQVVVYIALEIRRLSQSLPQFHLVRLLIAGVNVQDLL